MTAPEPTPTVEHVDAVALPSVRHIQAVGRVLWETSRADEGTMSAIGADLAATAILTSTDTAVHAALVAALVRAGVIAEETYVDWCDHEDRDPWEPGQWIKCGQPADHRGEHKDGCSGHRWPRRPDIDPSDKPEPRMRRYATEWSSKPTEADELTDTNDRSKP